MNRDTFRTSPIVQDFIEWAGPLPWTLSEREGKAVVVSSSGAVSTGAAPLPTGRLATLPVHLRIPRSSFVPRAVSTVVPFSELPLSYIWRARGMLHGDIAEAGRLLSTLAHRLRTAVAAGDWQLAQQICGEVLAWGGERNRENGARPDILRLGPGLPAYLKACDALMRLNTARLEADGSLAGVPHFGSMWVKIYALMSGTPIYDSRVAAAIATLVETWRIETGQTQEPLPVELRFHAVATRTDRTVRRCYERAVNPGSLLYGAATTPARWAGATVRLGWLIEELLGGDQDWRMAHALEAALFMAGADCSGINPPAVVPARARPGMGSQPGAAGA